MGIFGRLLGKQPSSSSDLERLVQTLLTFIQARTWPESRRVVEQHPELLTPAADDLLAQLAAAQDDEGARQLVEEHRALLRRCRQVDVAQAFEEKTTPSEEELTQALGELMVQNPLMRGLQALLEADSPAALLRVACDHPALFTPEAEELIRQGTENANVSGDERFAEAIDERYRALRELRDLAEQSGLTLGQAVEAFEWFATWGGRPLLEIRGHPLYHLAQRVHREELTLEAALGQATAPTMLCALNNETINDLDNHILVLSHDPACSTQDRVQVYLLAELNHAAAQALPASTSLRASTAMTLGICIDNYPHQTLAHLEQAVTAYQEALTIWQQETRPSAELSNVLGSAYLRLAEVQDREMNLERAIVAFRQALNIYTPAKAPQDYADTLDVLGSAYAELAGVRDREINLQRAINAYRQALRHHSRDTAPLEYAGTWNNLGAAYVDLSKVRDKTANLQCAIEAFHQALSIYTPVEAPLDYCGTMNNLGSAYLNLAQVQDCEANLERAIGVFQTIRSHTLITVQLATQVQNNLGIAYCKLAYVRDQVVNLERGIEAFHQALQFRTPNTDPLGYAGTQHNLGRVYSELAQVREREANLQRAIDAYHQALYILDRFFTLASAEAQLGLQMTWADLYADIAATHHQTGDAAQALAIAEGSKSRLLTALLGRGEVLAPPFVPADLVKQERARQSELAALDAADMARHGQAASAQEEAARGGRLARRRALVDELAAIWQQMEARGPLAREYVALRRGDRPAWADLARLAAGLGPETALLSLFTTGEKVLLFVLRGGMETPQMVEAALTPDELRYVYWTNYQDEVLNRRRHRQAGRPLTRRWRALGRPLLAPALPYLDGVRHVVLVPEGLLHLLPLHALTLDDAGETLLDRCAVSTIPALGLLARLRQREPVEGAGAVVLGYTPADPSTREGRAERAVILGEAVAVAEQMGVPPLLDERATAVELLTALHAQSLRLVHLSCHGHFDLEDPLRSDVWLADGPFTAREWMGLRFQADLVTLSACQTGMARALGGDELAGLSQALLYAGASSLVLGLWSVNAVTTAYLMVDFYRRLWDDAGHKQTDEAAALREATLALRDGKLLPPELQKQINTSDPYYWAPFVLVGNWR